MRGETVKRLGNSARPVTSRDMAGAFVPRPAGVLIVEGYPPASGYGGPAVSSSQLVEATRSLVDWRVVTRNDDVGKRGRLAPEATWLGDDPRIFRTNSYGTMFRELVRLRLREPPTLVVANSFFAPSTRALLLATASSRRLRPVVLPRGELDPGALAIKSRRKQVFISLLRRLGVTRRVIFGVTSELERGNVQRVLPEAQLWSIPCIPIDPRQVPFSDSPPGVPGSLRLVFNSRLDSKKCLELALAAVSRLSRDWDVRFDIYGNLDTEYGKHCRRLATRGPHPERFRWMGLRPAEEILPTLARYHAMLLPTRGENFGHAVFEALAAGTPPLIPDTTPWTAAVQAGAGLLLESLTEGALVRRLEELRTLPPDRQISMRRAARLSALNYYVGVNAQVSMSVRRLIDLAQSRASVAE